eukprot:683795-Pyramimonas_sp.AAC.1
MSEGPGEVIRMAGWARPVGQRTNERQNSTGALVAHLCRGAQDLVDGEQPGFARGCNFEVDIHRAASAPPSAACDLPALHY